MTLTLPTNGTQPSPSAQRGRIERVERALSPMALAMHASEHTQDPYIPYRHHALLNRKLVDVATGRCSRLIVNMPPQRGKSRLTSKFFPAWYLGVWPNNRVILASYEAEFAASWGRAARDVLEEWGPSMYGVDVSRTSSAANRWSVARPYVGGMVTAGAGGPITGKGANVFVIDDPIKNAKDVRSKQFRDDQREWYRGVVHTRLAPGAAIVVLMTRWHEDDLCGWLIEESESGRGDRFEVIVLPELALDGDPIGREPGDPLWPERYPLEVVEQIRRVSGPVVWSGLYQQQPSPADGEQFQRDGVRWWTDEPLSYVLKQANGDELRVPKAGCVTFTVGDLAISESDDAAFTVFATWTYTGSSGEPTAGKLILRDVFRDRIPGPEQLPALTATMAKNGATYAVLEAVQYQAALVQAARRAGLNVKPAGGKKGIRGDKVMRAQAAAAKWAAGDIYLPTNASWVGEFIEEHIKFPKGTYADQVDTTAYAAIEASEYAATKAPLAIPIGMGRSSPWN